MTAVSSPNGIHDCGDGLFLIDLDLPREGFRNFISAWLYIEEGTVLLVDCGPSATYEKLRASLRTLSIEKLDALLLTHIHLDHAGAAGLVVKDFSPCVICHPKGIPHLVAPKKLEQAAQKVLGDLACAYGPVSPVFPHMLTFQAEMNIGGIYIRALDTPGHAPHHLCFLVNDLLFAGEMCGVSYPIEGGYLRPATPPPFRYEEYRSSLSRVSDTPARLICLGHYGCYPEPKAMLKAALRQLDLWVETIRKDGGKGDWQSYFDALIIRDPLLSRFSALPPDIQKRELFFIANSIKGISALA